MITKQEAIVIVKHFLPGANINAFISYNDLYIFQVFHKLPNLEGEFGWSPFFSVNKNTGEFKDVLVHLLDDPMEVQRLFLNAQEGNTND